MLMGRFRPVRISSLTPISSWAISTSSNTYTTFWNLVLSPFSFSSSHSSSSTVHTPQFTCLYSHFTDTSTELDRLTSSTHPAGTTPSGDVTRGDLARTATTWLLSVQRLKRERGRGAVRYQRWVERLHKEVSILRPSHRPAVQGSSLIGR